MSTLSIHQSLTLWIDEIHHPAFPVQPDEQFAWSFRSEGEVNNNGFTLDSLSYTNPTGQVQVGPYTWSWGQWTLTSPGSVQLDSQGHGYLPFSPVTIGDLSTSQSSIPISVSPNLEIGCPPSYPRCDTFFLLGGASVIMDGQTVEMGFTTGKDFADNLVPEPLPAAMLALSLVFCATLWWFRRPRK
jgi:hypothetical protein